MISKQCLMNRLMVLVAILVLTACSGGKNNSNTTIDADGTVHVPAFDLPMSSLLSKETRKALVRRRAYLEEVGAAASSCDPVIAENIPDMVNIRNCYAEQFYSTSWYKSLTDRYDVKMDPQEIGGVYTEIFTSQRATAPENRNRVLINLHAGGFRWGAYTSSHLESIPIASVGGIKVISIDYRMAPEYRFPAASEDVAAVYRELLKKYKPENIGVYGCSAGGMLTAQSMAWFVQEGLPLPGAIGMFCGAGSKREGDTMIYGGLLGGMGVSEKTEDNPYFRNINLNNPLVTPVLSDEVMSKFPPSILISSTRDPLLSSVIHTHRQMQRLDRIAALHIWEGLDHAFIHDPNIPESREAYDAIVDFFDKHLGR